MTPVSDWCFLANGTQVAYVLEPLHGPQHRLYELVQTSTGKNLAEFVQMEGDPPTARPAWVMALDARRTSR